MLLTSILYSRLGIPHLAVVHTELLRDCYTHLSPIDERIRAMGRSAFILAQSGRYEEAVGLLEGIEAGVHRNLKFHQFVVVCVGLVKLRRAIRRYFPPIPIPYPSYYIGFGM